VLVGRGGGNKALLTAYFRPKIIIKSVHVCQSYSKLCAWTFWRHSVQCIPQRGRHETHDGNSENWWVSGVVLVKRNWPVGRLSSKLKFAWRCLQELQPHIIRVATLPWKMWVAYESDIVINNVSKGSVATHLRCRSSIVTLLSIYCWMQNLSVNEFLKSVKNWHSYSHEYCVFLFRNMVYMSTWCRRRRGVSKTVFESWWNKTNVCFLFFSAACSMMECYRVDDTSSELVVTGLSPGWVDPDVDWLAVHQYQSPSASWYVGVHEVNSAWIFKDSMLAEWMRANVSWPLRPQEVVTATCPTRTDNIDRRMYAAIFLTTITKTNTKTENIISSKLSEYKYAANLFVYFVLICDTHLSSLLPHYLVCLFFVLLFYLYVEQSWSIYLTVFFLAP